MSFQALFYPRAVAVYGSVSPGKLGNVLITHLVKWGFPKVYAVNPKGLGLDKAPGWKKIKDIPEPVDLAVIAAPAAIVKDILIECGEKGVKAAVIISSGFGEAGNAKGEAEIKEVAQKYGIRFIGPNCAGMINTFSNLSPTLQAYPPKGHTAVISQSGAVGGAIMELAQSHGLGISKFVSYGNGGDLNQIEFLHYLKDDEETKVVALYIENIENGREFMAALKAVTAIKPVVVIKSGRTNTGQRAALSHTGSMAGADAVYDAALKECGAIRVESLDDMIDLCKGFSYLPPVLGRKVAIVTNSGGPGVMTADKAEELKLDVCEPSPELIGELKSFLPAYAGFKNPIDMTVEGTGDNYRRVIEACLKEYDIVLPIFFGPPYLPTMPIAEGILAAFKANNKPVISAMETGLNVGESISYLRDRELPNFPSCERAIRTAARMAEYEEYKRKLKTKKRIMLSKIKETLFETGSLLEPDAMQVLRKNNIKVPDFRFVSDRNQVADAANELGYPIVMKVVSPQILHKSDFGGVELNIVDDKGALAAYDRIKKNAAGFDFRGVVMYPMLKGGREVILGLTTDKQFGPVVAFGLGGIYTEVLKDVVFRVAPIDQAEAKEMIREIKSYRILEGIRGQKPADLDALADTIAAFSQLPFIYPDIVEADLNPVFVFEDGVLAGDVRLVGRTE
ncbi:MAG: acetate--CoA ligase family protein [Bacillota bacterium]|jgi:acyl-CoA synthetase (NDP forming)